MIAVFKQIPSPLQKQALIRLGLGAVFFILLIALLFTVRDISLWLPSAGAALFFAASTISLFRRAVLGEYVVVSGVCQSVGLTAFRQRSKYMILQTGEHTVRAALHGRLRKVPAGTAVDFYIAKNTPIYLKDNMQVLYNYLAIDIKEQ
jgi:hypothetical protein